MVIKEIKNIHMKRPPFLKKGDWIGITCPAGYLERSKAQKCIDILQKWGYQVLVGNTLNSPSKDYFSASDEDRAEELQAMLDAPEIKAILCGRGGYGISRMIDQIDFRKFKKKPKWIIGFSDITLLHCHLHSKYKISSMHAPMATAFNEGENKYILSIKDMLSGKPTQYSIKQNKWNRHGKATGQLVGGNLALITHAIGTSSALNTKNKILFIEDIGEHLYQIDRMLMQLKRSGSLKNLAGLIVGHFSDLKDTTRPFGKIIEQIILEHVHEYSYPVCFGFPVGHEKENLALKIGATYTLDIGKKSIKLFE
jgi:muramoyltetrapeptide carboxypeptidase